MIAEISGHLSNANNLEARKVMRGEQDTTGAVPPVWSDVVKTIRVESLRWAGHVARMDESRGREDFWGRNVTVDEAVADHALAGWSRAGSSMLEQAKGHDSKVNRQSCNPHFASG